MSYGNNNTTNEIVHVGSFKVNAAFALLLVVMTAYFMWWGVGYTNGNNSFLFILRPCSVYLWRSTLAVTV